MRPSEVHVAFSRGEGFRQDASSACIRHRLYGAADARHMKISGHMKLRCKARAERENLEDGRYSRHGRLPVKNALPEAFVASAPFRFIGACEVFGRRRPGSHPNMSY